MNVKIIRRGELKLLNEEEVELYAKNGTKYKYCTIGAYECEIQDNGKNRKISINEGFLTDGSSKTPDIGISWLFHDYLYATHKIDEDECTREYADAVMHAVALYEYSQNRSSIFRLFARGIQWATYMNPFYVFDRAWKSSGTRGPEFAKSE